MWFRLTLALGHKSVKECQANIDSREFTEWLAYYRLEPFGPRRDDERIGKIVATLINVYSKRTARSKTWLDIFPDYVPRIDEPEPVTLKDKIVALNKALGGKDLRKTPD